MSNFIPKFDGNNSDPKVFWVGSNFSPDILKQCFRCNNLCFSDSNIGVAPNQPSVPNLNSQISSSLCQQLINSKRYSKGVSKTIVNPPLLTPASSSCTSLLNRLGNNYATRCTLTPYRLISSCPPPIIPTTCSSGSILVKDRQVIDPATGCWKDIYKCVKDCRAWNNCCIMDSIGRCLRCPPPNKPVRVGSRFVEGCEISVWECRKPSGLNCPQVLPPSCPPSKIAVQKGTTTWPDGCTTPRWVCE